MKKRIAFAGYSRVGKDTACDALSFLGYKKVAFGNIIKSHLDALCHSHLGFSAFTDDDDQKRQIRGLLEQWGEANYDNITKSFFEELPEMAVNARLVRLREASRWVDSGGSIVLIVRPGCGPSTDWERDRVTELMKSGLIDTVIPNGDVDVFRRQVVEYAKS